MGRRTAEDGPEELVERPGGAQSTTPSPPRENLPEALLSYRNGAPRRKVVLIIALGLDQATLREAIRQATPTEMDAPSPLFLIDQVDFDPLTEHHHLFEHVPSSASQAMIPMDLPWDRYIQRRLNLLILKWRPVSMIPLGRTSQQILSCWRERNARQETIRQP